MQESYLETPVITTPLTRRLHYLESFQFHTQCADFEMRLLTCFEAYGLKNKGQCKDYLDDFKECLLGVKRDCRSTAMLRERERRYKEGTKKELYAEPPPDYSY